ncbi:GGDEF domain-containing protein [Mesorhizobium sp. M0199]|uniref:GGDEF domain-containing protein n=1 Tax=Mesorhizobium sp. M0199 TaxID=2956911 RepID=UPI0033356809
MDEIFRKLLHLCNDTPVLAAAYDGFDRLRYANQAFRSAYFLEADETPLWSDLMRRNFETGRGTVIRAGDFDAWLISTQSRRGKMGFRAFETDLVDGRWLWMTETVQSDGWMLCIANDITKLRAHGRTVRQDLDKAIKASNTDELTGVANRRFVTARMGEMLQRMQTEGRAGCVCVLDLDNLKYINDRYGHQAGDVILGDFAVRIQREVRRSDCFGRVGGEEFVVVLPNTPTAAAELIVARMLAAIRNSRPLSQSADFGYSFSAGIAAAQRGDTIDDVLARADTALYSAKMAGRNRIHLAA